MVKHSSSIALVLIVGLSLIGAGCSSFGKNEASEKLIVQYATMKVIEADKDHVAERAAKINTVASEAKSFFDSGTATVDGLQLAVRERLAPLNLSPADAILADALISTVVAELQTRVGEGLVVPDQLYQVSTVLGWVIDATAFYTR